ncbi:DUF6928 family protein [Zavarzinella formosa]|uniref:DUF6928 family protein n=1 Tax=Zavarzinella formosa TaxID=360055 RepID=UPI000305C249|nr:hypothetical protein [Zavarzinella formosa]
MGWKASCILASNREDGYLGALPAHDPQRADEIIRQLGMGAFERVGPSTFDEGIYPQDDSLYVGAYDGAIVLGSEEVAAVCISEKTPSLILHLADCLPNARMMAMVLHSVVNLYGYAIYENGKLLRVRAGSSDAGVFLDKGEPLPEEQMLFAKSIMKDGQRVYPTEINGEVEEFSEDCVGEEFVFELSRRFLGKRFDQFDAWELKMEKFARVKRSIWSWFKKG